MTGPDNFLTRWSRLKRQTPKAGEDQRPTPTGPGKPTLASEVDPVSRDVSTAPTVDIASLPSIDSITAETDIRAFLAPGVPRELAAAALRRAWVADPAIRDFVGPADYAWDYHAPGSMPGFGPLEMTDDLRRMVARIIGVKSDENFALEGSNAQISPEHSNDSQSLDLHDLASSDAVPKPSKVALAKTEALPTCGILSSQQLENAAPQKNLEKPESNKHILHRGHGRALPK